MPFTPVMAIGAGVCSAVAFFSIAFGSALALPLFYLAPLPLYLAGLGIGMKGAVLALVASVFTMVLIGGTMVALPFAVAYGIPAAILAQQALRMRPGSGGQPAYTSVGDILSSLTVLGLVILFFAAMTTSVDPNTGSLEDLVISLISRALEVMAAEVPSGDRDMLAGTLAPFFPGLVVSGWLMMHVVNAALAQSTLIKSGNGLRPAVRYSDMTLPEWSSWVLVGTGMIAIVLPGDWAYIGRNAFLVAMAPFFVLGLVVVHRFARTMVRPTGFLMPFYIVLLLIGWSAVIVVFIGALEQWVGLRQRMKIDHNEEKE